MLVLLLVGSFHCHGWIYLLVECFSIFMCIIINKICILESEGNFYRQLLPIVIASIIFTIIPRHVLRVFPSLVVLYFFPAFLLSRLVYHQRTCCSLLPVMFFLFTLLLFPSVLFWQLALCFPSLFLFFVRSFPALAHKVYFWWNRKFKKYDSMFLKFLKYLCAYINLVSWGSSTTISRYIKT